MCTRSIHANAEQLRGSPERIARWLKYLSRIRILDTQSYMHSVAKKKGIRKKKGAAPSVQSLKAENRSKRRRISKLMAQNTKLRHQVRSCIAMFDNVFDDVFGCTIEHCLIGKCLCMQVKQLKQVNKVLNRTVAELEDTIAELKSGDHDIQLEGVSQKDMETILDDCVRSPELQKQIHHHDPSGTLAAFWKEQVSSDTLANTLSLILCICR